MSDELSIFDPPIDSPIDNLGKSAFAPSVATSLSNAQGTVLLQTLNITATPNEKRPIPIPERTIISLGDPRKGPPSRLVGTEAEFELKISLLVHNLSEGAIRLCDIKAHIYHVSMYSQRLAIVPWAPRVQLAADNTADLAAVGSDLSGGRAQPIDLVLETSVFDTLFTTVVFGLTVFYEIAPRDVRTVHHVPSDKIYIFQHDHHWGASKCHFVSRSAAEIEERRQEAPGDHGFFDSLLRIVELHTSPREQKSLSARAGEQVSTAPPTAQGTGDAGADQPLQKPEEENPVSVLFDSRTQVGSTVSELGTDFVVVGLTLPTPEPLSGSPNLYRHVYEDLAAAHNRLKHSRTFFAITSVVRSPMRNAYWIVAIFDNEILNSEALHDIEGAVTMLSTAVQTSLSFETWCGNTGYFLVSYSDEHKRVLAVNFGTTLTFTSFAVAENKRYFTGEYEPEYLAASGLFIGTCHFFLGRYGQAISEWQFSTSHSAHPNPFFNIACAYSKLGDISQAYEYCMRAVEHGVSRDLVLHDPDLSALRQHSSYTKIKDALGA